MGAAGAVDAHEDSLAAGVPPGQLCQRVTDHRLVVGDGVDPAFPGRSSTAIGSPVPAGPWSTKAHRGWWPKPRLNVGAAASLSEWAVTRVASTSITSGDAADAAWSGARSPA